MVLSLLAAVVVSGCFETPAPAGAPAVGAAALHTFTVANIPADSDWILVSVEGEVGTEVHVVEGWRVGQDTLDEESLDGCAMSRFGPVGATYFVQGPTAAVFLRSGEMEEDRRLSTSGARHGFVGSYAAAIGPTGRLPLLIANTMLDHIRAEGELAYNVTATSAVHAEVVANGTAVCITSPQQFEGGNGAVAGPASFVSSLSLPFQIKESGILMLALAGDGESEVSLLRDEATHWSNTAGIQDGASGALEARLDAGEWELEVARDVSIASGDIDVRMLAIDVPSWAAEAMALPVRLP